MDSPPISGPLLLLNLPVEIQLDIIELVDLRDWERDRRLHTMANLRLTCKELAFRCEPVFFRSLTTRYSDPKSTRYISLCERYGKHVQNLMLEFSPVGDIALSGDTVLSDTVLSSVLGHCLNVRKFSIKHEGRYTTVHLSLVLALPNFTRLEALHIMGSGGLFFFSHYVNDSLTVHDHLLNAVLDHHSSRLRYLSLSCSASLHPSTFCRVRDKATHLRKIDSTQTIGVQLRSILAEPQRWACADHLQHIRLVSCQGVHAAIFSNQLAAGVFGHPRTVRLAICGDYSDQQDLPRAPKWTIPRLELLELDHFSPWEMRYLGQIHAEVVRTDRTWQRGRELLVEVLKAAAMFPGVQVLQVADTWEEEHLGGLKEACLSRGIKAVELVRFGQYD